MEFFGQNWDGNNVIAFLMISFGLLLAGLDNIRIRRRQDPDYMRLQLSWLKFINHLPYILTSSLRVIKILFSTSKSFINYRISPRNNGSTKRRKLWMPSFWLSGNAKEEYLGDMYEIEHNLREQGLSRAHIQFKLLIHFNSVFWNSMMIHIRGLYESLPYPTKVTQDNE